MEITKVVFNFLIFPGFLFASSIGLLASWLERKVSAWVQWRVGPPWYQPFIDFVKLCTKELIIPRDAQGWVFLLSPLIGLVGVSLVCQILGTGIISQQNSFLGDIIVVLYLLTFPSLAIILGGFASANPLASLGSSREMKLVLAYELPFLLAVFISIVKSGMVIKVGEILASQTAHPHILSYSGIIGFFVALICIQAKIGLTPFDLAEAETEIMAGSLAEYSGIALGFFKLTKAMMLFAGPLFLIILFWGGLDFSGWQALWSVLKYVLILVLMILIKNTNPRLRIDQVLRFFWGKLSLLAIIGVVLALMGK